MQLAPAPALDNLVANFTTAKSPQTMLARWTLPFGILAFPTLRKPSPANTQGASVNYNRPNFPRESVTGGYQVSVSAIDPTVAVGSAYVPTPEYPMLDIADAAPPLADVVGPGGFIERLTWYRDMLADEWGVDPLGDGKEVWARLRVRAGTGRAGA